VAAPLIKNIEGVDGQSDVQFAENAVNKNGVKNKRRNKWHSPRIIAGSLYRVL
jgi:hypothetical protein